MRKIGAVAARLAAGAVIGGLIAIAFGQLVGVFASGCTLACDPGVAGTAGAVAGAVASFSVEGYRPG